MKLTSRRSLLGGLSLSPYLSLQVQPILAAPSDSGELSVDTLAPGVSLIRGGGTNVVVAEDTDAVVVAGGGNNASSEKLLATINELTNSKPIKALFNLSWRPEYCGLNYLLGPKGVKIFAHENTRLWQGADFYSDWQDTRYTPMPKATQANQTFYKQGHLAGVVPEMGLGREGIDYGFISQANSDGDIFVHFKKANILVTGAMLDVKSYIEMDYVTGGWIVGAQKCTADLLARCTSATKIVPAVGGVQQRDALEEQATLLEKAYEGVSWAFQNGKSLDEFIASRPMADFEDRWGPPELFLLLLYRSTWLHVPGRAVRNII